MPVCYFKVTLDSMVLYQPFGFEFAYKNYNIILLFLVEIT